MAVRDTLKTSSRKPSQVVLFKGTKKIFATDVDNFVRKYPNATGICPDRLVHKPERRRRRGKWAFLFNGLQNRTLRTLADPFALRRSHRLCA
jgi:hypothetical protein